MDSILYIVISVLFAGTFLMMLELPFVSGPVLASGAGERIAVRLLVPILLLGGLCVPVFWPEYFVNMTSGLLKVGGIANVLPVGIATAVAAMAVRGFSRYAAVPFAFIAALAGLGLAGGKAINSTEVLPYIVSWTAAPILCGLFSAIIYMMFAAWHRNRNTHMALMEARILSASTVAAFILIPLFALNNSLIFNYLPSGLGYRAAIVACVCAVLIWPLVRRMAVFTKWNIADYELDTNPQSVFSLMAGMILCFAMFTSPLPGKIGLASTPLPAGTLYIAALAGISICSRRTLTDGSQIIKGAVAMYLSPLMAFLLAYCLGRIMDGEITGTLIVFGIILLVAGITIFIRHQSRLLMDQQIARAHEQQVYSTRKSLSALEVRAEMTEKDLLNKLDLKRKELVDFAVGISDQKDFMESVYEQLKEVRATREGAERDARTDSLLRSLRERMYFTREMNDFYARSEELHKDFNEKLAESFPHLTENEKKLANLLRQGFSSKYIASLMNITPKSVEINRYRLRAKLGLERGENLIKFIKSI